MYKHSPWRKTTFVMSILIENLSKTFLHFKALNTINLEIKAESLVALVGGSGSGKSTLLRVIAGLETPDEGRVWLSGNYALFKDMTVYENIAFGLDIRNLTVTTVKNRVTQLLQLVQLEKLAARYPSQLSGGQRQRVALARALAIEPKVLLLDEPFGALDSKVRRGLRQWLRQLHDQVPVTTVFVTHDQQEALEVASDIVILEHGQINQMGLPQDMYTHLRPLHTSSYAFL